MIIQDSFLVLHGIIRSIVEGMLQLNVLLQHESKLATLLLQWSLKPPFSTKDARKVVLDILKLGIVLNFAASNAK